MQLSDKTLVCKDCKTSFLWTAGEQAFYRERGLMNIPARCPECRGKRSTCQGTSTAVKVTCARCGQATTVPFTPKNGKPVYCSPCFRAEQEEARNRETS